MVIQADPVVSGIYSRSENLVRTTRDYDRGRANETALNEAFRLDANQFAELQASLDFPYISDGQLRWQDFLRPFSENVKGLESGADLSRWFDTNTFYKKPKVTNRLIVSSPFFEHNNYSEIFDSRKARLSIALPGPYTLASLVEDKFYNSKEELVHAFAKVIKEVIASLDRSLYSYIQVNEPSLVYRYGNSGVNNPNEFQFFMAAFKENLDTVGNIALHTYFGDSSKVLPSLVKLEGVSTLGIDFTQTPLTSVSAQDLDGKTLGCGCVDARSSLVESPEWISDFCFSVAKNIKSKNVVLMPSCDLKYLPRTYADRKVVAMSKASKIIRKMSVNSS
jgi:methionine synthase II (cobalamin-independent)